MQRIAVLALALLVLILLLHGHHTFVGARKNAEFVFDHIVVLHLVLFRITRSEALGVFFFFFNQ